MWMMMLENLRPMPVSPMVPTMMPMTPTVAPMTRVALAPPTVASHISLGPMRYSGSTQLMTMQLTVAQNALMPGEKPMSMSTTMTMSGRDLYQWRLNTTMAGSNSSSTRPLMSCFLASKWIMDSTLKK